MGDTTANVKAIASPLLAVGSPSQARGGEPPGAGRTTNVEAVTVEVLRALIEVGKPLNLCNIGTALYQRIPDAKAFVKQAGGLTVFIQLHRGSLGVTAEQLRAAQPQHVVKSDPAEQPLQGAVAGHLASLEGLAASCCGDDAVWKRRAAEAQDALKALFDERLRELKASQEKLLAVAHSERDRIQKREADLRQREQELDAREAKLRQDKEKCKAAGEKELNVWEAKVGENLKGACKEESSAAEEPATRPAPGKRPPSEEDGWECYLDPNTRRHWWFHHATGECRIDELSSTAQS